jgi:hypothetical protein
LRDLQQDHVRDGHARPRQPDLRVRRRAHGLCDLVRRLPTRRHQPSRHPAAVPGRLPDQLRARVQDRLVRPSPRPQRCGVR